MFLSKIAALVQAQVSSRQPDTHHVKHATPTMAGVIFVGVTVLVSCMSFAFAYRALLVLVSGVLFCLLGAWDDWCKVAYKQGISARTKFALQIGIAFFLAICWYALVPTATVLIPGIGSFWIGPLFVLWAIWILLATTNAVNLTDGLDGLAASTVIVAVTAYAVIMFFDGTLSSALGIVLASLISSLFGFLWFNLHPARMFMGDAGSLALGGMLAVIALISRYEVLLPVIGAVFVVEVLSVIVQVASYKLTGKRLLRMSPLHHHFEMGGMKENSVVLLFVSGSIVFAVLGIFIFFAIQT